MVVSESLSAHKNYGRVPALDICPQSSDETHALSDLTSPHGQPMVHDSLKLLPKKDDSSANA